MKHGRIRSSLRRFLPKLRQRQLAAAPSPTRASLGPQRPRPAHRHLRPVRRPTPRRRSPLRPPVCATPRPTTQALPRRATPACPRHRMTRAPPPRLLALARTPPAQPSAVWMSPTTAPATVAGGTRAPAKAPPTPAVTSITTNACTPSATIEAAPLRSRKETQEKVGFSSGCAPSRSTPLQAIRDSQRLRPKSDCSPVGMTPSAWPAKPEYPTHVHPIAPVSNAMPEAPIRKGTHGDHDARDRRSQAPRRAHPKCTPECRAQRIDHPCRRDRYDLHIARASTGPCRRAALATRRAEARGRTRARAFPRQTSSCRTARPRPAVSSVARLRLRYEWSRVQRSHHMWPKLADPNVVRATSSFSPDPRHRRQAAPDPRA